MHVSIPDFIQDIANDCAKAVVMEATDSVTKETKFGAHQTAALVKEAVLQSYRNGHANGYLKGVSE